ncbi:MAG: amino acid carrier protein [Planctomycetota bacterium]
MLGEGSTTDRRDNACRASTSALCICNLPLLRDDGRCDTLLLDLPSRRLMEAINNFVNDLNGILFSQYVITTLLITGLIFTVLTLFGQWRAVTHGIDVVRGKYDEKDDPGAISHFQALATALSATVGLGNIAGVAIAVSLGGPGAVFWMWIIGILGMALKMTEVTQSMLYRNTEDPKNPHGGPMFVAKYGFERLGLPKVGAFIGGLFVVTLLISAATGGNMFQVWNAADTTFTNFNFPKLYTGAILASITFLVIIGGIRWIGRVASIIVPFMCVVYLLAALWVLGNNITAIPGMLWDIVVAGIGYDQTAGVGGAFVGGTVGFAIIQGMKRALFSSEAGQGSAPIAHAAVKTDEPVREGVVAGLEPLIDTVIVCTITALVLLSTGAFNREAEATFAANTDLRIIQATGDDGEPLEDTWTLADTMSLPSKTEFYRTLETTDPFRDIDADAVPEYKPGEPVFVRVEASKDADSGSRLRKLFGEIKVKESAAEATTQPSTSDVYIDWGTITSERVPVLAKNESGEEDRGLYVEYIGSTLTSHAFDRTTPGLGKYLITLAVWLFAISTIISWSYYGEQGVVFLTSGLSEGGQKAALLIYKALYCGLIMVTVLPIPGWLSTADQLDMWTTLGLGVMLVVNVPLMWLFGMKAMAAYHDYIGRFTAGPMHDEIGHEAESTDPGPVDVR